MKAFNKKSYSGITMIELLIAIALGSVVTAAVIQVFLSNKQTSRLQEQMSRLQENGRFAMEIISRDLRSADYWGCVGDKSRVFNNIKPGVAEFIDLAEAIDGDDGVGDAPDSLFIAGSVHVDESLVRVDQPFASGEPIPVTGAGAVDLVDKTLVVGDCEKSNVFVATAANNTQVIHGLGKNDSATPTCPGGTHCFSNGYNQRALLYEAYTAEYKVVDKTLIRTFNGQDTRIASGISNFQVQYGIDQNNDETADLYVNRTNLGANIDQVVSIRVHLLLETLEDNTATTANSVLFNWAEDKLNGNTVNLDNLQNLKTTINDNRVRRPFVVTVAIRNRIS
ncbi:MAG: PilW family protein [Pseudomonadota bacterium]